MPYYPTTSKTDRYEIVCQLPLTSELFCQAIHPNEPVVAVGMSSGHVQSFRLPSDEDNEGDDSDDDSTGGRGSVGGSTLGAIETQWKTRRHKGSCRSLGYSLDGETLYSAGTDNLLKAFDSSTGKVTSKIIVPFQNDKEDYPTLLRALTPQTLLLACDSSALHLYDLREPAHFASAKPAQTHRPHDDYISSLSPLPPTSESTSGFSKQWVTTGGTTLAVTDLRRGVLVKSEDQEEELLSSVVVGGFPTRGNVHSQGQKVVVGSGNGVLTLWERGVWDDQDERVIVMPGGKSGGDSIDCLAVVPNGRREVAAGCGDGKVRIANLTGKGVQETLLHDVLEGVLGVGFDSLGRLISGGGNMVKVWAEKDQSANYSDDGMDSDEEEDDSDDEPVAGKRKKADASSDEDSSSEEEKPKNKKGKRGPKDKLAQTGVLGFDIE